MKVHLSAGAKRDLAAITGWIAADDPAAAVRFGDQLVAKSLAIGDTPLGFPLAGLPSHPELRKRVLRGYSSSIALAGIG